MGNGISVDVDANAAALRAVLQRYEDLKKQDLAIRTDRELYNELLPELQAALEVVIRGPSSLLLPASLSQQGQRLHPLDGRQVSVLVVDDSHISCKLASRALESINLVPKVAYSGEAALMLLKRDPAAFDFVLLDIVMPGLDGIEVLSRIRHNPALARLPVAMLSGLEDKTLAEVCLHQGAVQVLIKPVKAEDVIAAVNRHVLGVGSPVTPVDA
ncbi:CheY-like superfamily protein, partial [Tribonema minus]